MVVVAGCAGAQPQEEVTPTPIPTPIVPTKPTYEVQRGEVVRKLEFSGRIAPVVEHELFFRAAGFVGAVFVARDDEVKVGDVLAELEVTDLKNALAQAEAALAVTISNNEQRIAEAEAALNTAELRLAQMKADDPSPQVTIAAVNLERAQTAVKDAQKAYQETVDQPWLRDPERALEAAARQVHEAELSLDVAEAQYQQARQAVEAHGYGVQIQEQAVELARLRLETLETGADIEEIRLTVERLEAQLADARITAPIDGKVLSIYLDEGRDVQAYMPVAIVADLGELEVSADLVDSNMRDLVEGMPAAVVPVAYPDREIEAQIRLLPYPYGGGGRSQGVGEQDTSTRVSLDMAAVGENVELSDLMRVTVVLEQKDDVLWLPPQAIRLFEGRKFVVVQDGEAQRRVDVKIGIEGEDRVEIEEGVTEGAIVIGP
jgi:multidrug efflux pump subunit AcrA (membrane-fusion protein)